MCFLSLGCIHFNSIPIYFNVVYYKYKVVVQRLIAQFLQCISGFGIDLTKNKINKELDYVILLNRNYIFKQVNKTCIIMQNRSKRYMAEISLHDNTLVGYSANLNYSLIF